MIGTNNQDLTRVQKIYRWIKIISGTLAIIGAISSTVYGVYTWHKATFVTVDSFENYKEDRQRVIDNLQSQLDSEAAKTRQAVIRLARAWYKSQISEIQTDINALEQKKNNSGLSEFEQSALLQARSRLNELKNQLGELPNETIID